MNPDLSQGTKGKGKGKDIVTFLEFELTERCNNNCRHCYINLSCADHYTQKKEISTSKVKDILKQASLLGCKKVRFTGGEPFLRDDFMELYLFSRKLSQEVIITTNASLITKKMVDIFLRSPSLPRFEISIYGMNRNSFDSVTRSKGSFEKTAKGVNLLLKHGIPFSVKNAYPYQNKEELKKFEKWINSIPASNKVVGRNLIFSMRSRRDSVEKNAMIKSLRFSPQEILAHLTRDKKDYIKGMKAFCSYFIGPQGKKVFTCTAALSSASVDAYGVLQPCLLLRHPDAVYDLSGGSLKEAVTDFFPRVKKTQAVNPEYISRCAKCFLKGLCWQCPAQSWMEHGSMDTPVEYLCEIAHIQARYLGMLNKEEFGWEVKNWRKRVSKFIRGK